MKFHIIRNGETLRKIAFSYNLDEEELKKENKHIRYWDKLIPGTKLKIPVIPEAVDRDITEMEPFVEDYYPKLKLGTQIESSKLGNKNYYELDGEGKVYQKEDENKEENQKQEQIQIKQTNVDPIVSSEESYEKKDDNKVKEGKGKKTAITQKNIEQVISSEGKKDDIENGEEKGESRDTPNIRSYLRPLILPYYYSPYYQYPRYFYPQYVYPIYLYPRRWY